MSSGSLPINQFLDDERAARAAIERDPRDATAWHELGKALAAQWRMAEAETALKKATSLASTFAEAWADLAFVQVTRGQLDAGMASSRQATRLRSDLGAPHRYRALAFASQGQIDAAALAAGEARRLDPVSADGLILLAAIWSRAGLRDGARRLIDRVVVEHSESAEALVVRAEMRIVDDPSAADADLAAALTLKPWLPPAHFARAVLRRLQQRLPDALESIAAARARHPDSEDYLLLHIDLLEEAGEIAAAAALAQEQLRHHTQSRVLRMRLAMLLLRQGEIAQAVRHVPGVLPHSTAAVVWRVLADTWQAIGRHGERRTCLERALAERRDSDVLLALVQVQLLLGDTDGAMALVGELPDAPSTTVVRAEALTRLGKRDEAIGVLETELARSGDDALCCMRLGILYREQKAFDKAEPHLRRAAALAPRESVTHEQLGVLLSEQRRFDEALAALQKAIDAGPARVQPRFNAAVLFARQQRWAEAERAFREIAAVTPLNLSVHGNLGSVLAAQQRYEDAIDVFSSVIELTPCDPGPRQGLIGALSSLRQNDGAVAAARRWTDDAPDDPLAWRSLALALAAVNDAEADRAADRVEALSSDQPLIFEVRGLVAHALSRPHEALSWFDRALAHSPTAAGVMVNRALTLDEVEGLDAAERQLLAALALEPDSQVVQMNLSMVQLRLGRFAAGWRGYHARSSALRGPTTLIDVKAGRGARPDLSSSSVLVRAEQGLGDTIQFMRYVRRLAQDAREVWFHMQDQIAWMAWELAPNVRVSGYRDPIPAADYQVSLLSLPGYYDTGLESIPGETPYLAADHQQVTAWRARLGSDGFKVGIVWHTNPMHGNVRRWIPLQQLLPLGRLPGVRLISLQKLYGLEQLEQMPGDVRVETLGESFDEGPDAFADAAAVIANLDLVISIDTSMCHIAGALNRPVWTLLPYSSDWRWLTNRVDTPWYPSMRLFQQAVSGRWTDVAEQIEGRLQAVIDGRSSAVWPVGETTRERSR